MPYSPNDADPLEPMESLDVGVSCIQAHPGAKSTMRRAMKSAQQGVPGVAQDRRA